MMNYEELVEALRYCVSGVCKNCSYFEKCKKNGTAMSQLHNDAAAAIEALQAQLPKRGEIVRCGECKYHLPETERTNPYCNKFHCMKPDDWYCADGERRVQE